MTAPRAVRRAFPPSRVGRLAVLCLVGMLAAGETARAGPGPAGVPAARGPSDVYERGRASLRDILVFVTRDLRLRVDAWPRPAPDAPGPGAVLVLVVDPTASLHAEMAELRDALVEAVAEGPRGLKVGVLGAAAEWTPPGHVGEARTALDALESAPVAGTKNLLESVREAAATMEKPATEPRAIVLVTREGGEGEDDVEATREVLKERGVTFHAVAPEAAFERPWTYDFIAHTVPDLGLTQRFHPMPRNHRKGELYFGGDTAFGLVPYRWELRDLPFAQADFAWSAGGRFPVPSGFGPWCLATLAWTSGGRCFVYNFRAPGARTQQQDRNLQLYDMGFLNLFAPDLRPRREVLKALEQDRKALTIVRIWDLLADDEAPIVLDHGTLEREGNGLAARPMLPVRSLTPVETAYRYPSQVERAREIAVDRRQRAEQALSWWVDEEKREVTPTEGATVDPLRERTAADFELLGAQILKVRFHWGEVIAALDGIERATLDGDREVRLSPMTIARGVTPVQQGFRLPDSKRAAAYVESLAQGRRITIKYRGTPWALVVEKGETFTFQTQERDLRPPPQANAPDAPASRPPPPPPPRPAPQRPSSGVGGPTTGGK